MTAGQTAYSLEPPPFSKGGLFYVQKRNDQGNPAHNQRKNGHCALLCALSVVFARFTTVMPSAISRFSIEAVPIALAGYFFGPIAGLMVGAVSDTVGCLFSGYGWDPVLTVSPMLLGLFAGLLRPVLYRMEKPWDFWRVAVTLLPGKVLGSVLWQSYWLIFLGYSKKAMGPLIASRPVWSWCWIP